MKIRQWLAIDQNGIQRVRKSKPDLGWNEIAIAIELDIPDELFMRPVIEARVEVKDVPKDKQDVNIILNTKELIEQQTGAKINFSIVDPNEEPQ